MFYAKLTQLEMNWLITEETNLGRKMNLSTADYGVIKPPRESECNQSAVLIVVKMQIGPNVLQILLLRV